MLVVISSLVPACQLAAAGCFSAPPGLISWWPGDGTANDIAGTNTGTLQGGATATAAGVVGSAFNFDGTNGYVQIPDAPSLKPTNLTVEAWVNFSGLDSALSGTAPSGDQYIVFKQNSQAYSFEGYSLEKFRIANGDAFMFTVGSASGQEVALLSATLVTTSVWYHVAAVRGSNFMQLYVNGQLERQTNVSFAQDYGTLPLYFGTSHETYWDGKLNGRLDEVSLYDRALSSNEVVATYAAGAAGKCKGASLLTQPQSQTAVAGSNALFTVTATGVGLLSYQWQFNGVGIAAASSTSLVLTNVQTTNAGSYTVAVTNLLGSVTSAAAALMVLVPPSITSQPASVTNECTSAATFSVAAAGTAPLSYQWCLNGGLVSNGTSTNLAMANVHAAQQGNYTVVVTNSAGSITSAPALLTVMDTTPPVITLNGANPLTNECHAAFVDPGATASDTCAGSLGVTANSAVNPNAVGVYTIKYSAIDPSANGATNTRTVYVVDRTAPVIMLNGANPLTNAYQSAFVDPGATASDACAGSLGVATTSAVNTNAIGVYTIQYTASDPSGNSATNTRTVYVADAAAPPGDCAIEDPQLEQAIRCTLTNFNRPLSADDWTKLTCLWACKRQITNLTGLQCATNLASLYLDDNAITDLTPLQSLTRLSSLELYNNGIGNLSPLAGLTNLTCLVLGGYPVTDYSPLSGLTNLVSLSVRAGILVNLTTLQSLTRLNSLRLWENGITNILPLAGLTNLACLDLRWNSITNFASSLTGLTNLTSLYLGGNSLASMPALQGLQQLTLLNLDDNSISDLSALTNLPRLNYLAVNRDTNAAFSALSNLPGLVNLELRGNSISDVAFLSGLSHLTYVDLAYNSITNIGPLTSLTGLNSLVLAGNPLPDFSPVGSIPNLTNVWLFDNAITNSSFLASLLRLNHLNLDQNQIADIGPLLGLMNLTGLGLSRNPITNYAVLSGLTNLTSLRLEANCLGDADLPSFLPSLTQLAFLDVNHNRIADLSPVVGLTNCQELYLRENRLRSITNLAGLPNLLDVNVSLNTLDLSSGSAAMSVIQDLQCVRAGPPQCPCGSVANGGQGLPCQGITVTFSPQDEPPAIFPQLPSGFPPLSSYAIACNATSSIPILVYDDVAPDGLPPCDPLVVVANSSDPGGVTIVNNPLPGTNSNYAVTVNAGNATGSPVDITLVATDGAGLTSSNSFSVTVVCPIGLSNLCANLDSNLVAAISSAAGKAAADLTTLDLLRLTYLGVNNANVSGFCGWLWLTNLTTLALSGYSITNLTFLTNMPQLSFLALNNGGVTNFAPLGGLTNLANLTLSGDPIRDLSFLTNVTQLVSLTLYKTRVADLSPLAGLTNLQFLHLQQNRIVNILSLTNLPQLSYVDLSLNLLDLSPSSATMAALQALVNRGVTVSYLPQRQPPAITMNANWVIAANTPSWLYLFISDNAQSSDLSATASALNTDLIPNSNLAIGNVPTFFGLDWFLDVTPASNQFGTTTIILTAVNDAGLTTTTSIVVTVEAPLPLDGPVFPDTNLTSWVTAGEGLWFGQNNVSYAGLPAAQSGSITNNEASCLQAAVNGPGILTFWWKVSSETNFDFLTFYIDTNKQAQVSGEVDWQEQVYGVSPGLHTLLWKYSKDQNTSRGMDAGWLAQVSFVPASWLRAVGPSPSGPFRFTLYGVPGNAYQILASSDFVNWLTQGTVIIPATNTSGTQIYTDSLSTSFPKRFYRAQQQP